jgi:hypothetical protein
MERLNDGVLHLSGTDLFSERGAFLPDILISIGVR